MTDTSRAPDRRVAIVAFYDSERRILLQDRRGMAKAGEEWGFFGGGMEPGESPRRAAAREIAEELAYAVPDPVPVGVRSSPLPDGRVVERHVFAAPLPPDWRVRFAQRG